MHDTVSFDFFGTELKKEVTDRVIDVALEFQFVLRRALTMMSGQKCFRGPSRQIKPDTSKCVLLH